LIDFIETFDNPKGLCSLNDEGDYLIIASPDQERGHVYIKNYSKWIFCKKLKDNKNNL